MSSICPAADTKEYRISISLVLCIDYNTLEQHEKDALHDKLATFSNKKRDSIKSYRINILGKDEVYNEIMGPPGLNCSTKTKLNCGIADSGGWSDAFIGYQTSVDVEFQCFEEANAEMLKSKIIDAIAVNKLDNYMGYHVIGWVSNLWHCTTTEPTTTEM